MTVLAVMVISVFSGINGLISNGMAEKYVLSPFKKENDNIIKTIIQTTCEGIEYYLSHDINETMNEFNNNNLTKGKND